MKNYVLMSGAFTQAGNFTGYTPKGERIHVHGKQMNNVGIKADEDIKFPLFVIGDIKKIGQLDENGEAKLNEDGSPVQVDRLTALSVYKSKDELINVYAEEATLSFEITKGIKERATSAGLTEAELTVLANQSW
jgi:hypothetical protein